MEAVTERALREIDRRFYAHHADGFAGSRRLAWPGWERALAPLGEPIERDRDRALRVLDAGCAHGRLAHDLLSRFADRSLAYVGIDASLPLLRRARRSLSGLPRLTARLALAGLLSPPPVRCAHGDRHDGFDLIALFGVLHHIPGQANRRRLVGGLAERLAPGGRLVLTAWRVERQPGFAHKRVPWHDLPAGLPKVDPRDLEPGDHLLVWGDDRRHPRYCHALGDDEVDDLVPAAGVTVADRFASDGPRNDRNRYLVLSRAG